MAFTVRFNSAAALRPRKASFTVVPARAEARLQFGRGSEAAEGTTAAALTRPTADCFNSAAALRPRKATHCCPGRRLSPGFNSAAALRPRKALLAVGNNA